MLGWIMIGSRSDAVCKVTVFLSKCTLMELLNTDISIYLSNASLKLRLHLDTNSVFYFFLKSLYKM